VILQACPERGVGEPFAQRVGKRARVRERRYTGPEETVEPGLLHQQAEEATDADGMTAEEAVLEGATSTDTSSEQSETPADNAAPVQDAAAEVESLESQGGSEHDESAAGDEPQASSTSDADVSSDAGEDASEGVPAGDSPA